MPEQRISIRVEPPDDKRRYRVIATANGRQHVDRIDVDIAFVRQKWREAVIKECRLEGEWNPETGSDDAAIHAELENKLMAAVLEADMGPPIGLWTPEIATMASVESKQTDWLMPSYIPAGAITVFDGNPGTGKSQTTCDMSARVSVGNCMPPKHAPPGTNPPRGVLMLNAEDDPARTIRPRLEAAGADLARVHFLRSMASVCGDERPVSLPSDLPAIEAAIRQHDVSLVTIDPFVAFLDSKLSVNNDADVRRCLGQLATVAEDTGAAIVLIRHMNKKSGIDAIYRGGGSIGITGAARAVFMVGIDPADDGGRILAPVKCNLAPEPPSLRFTIESYQDTSRVRWGDVCDTTAHDLCQPAKGERGNGGKLDTAKEIIRDLLANGPRGSNEVMQACVEAGLGERTYHSARKALGIKSERSGFSDGQWLLTMPANGYHHEEF